MQRKKAFFVTLILVLALFLAYFVFTSFIYNPAPSLTVVRLNFYDYSTKEVMKGLSVKFNMTTRTGDAFTISGFSDENGSIVQVLPTNDIVFPVSARSIFMSGCWVLEETTGEKAWSIADQKWVPRNPTAFLSNSSEYIFDEEVHLLSERNGSKLSLRLDFYLAAGKIMAINDPIPESGYYDPIPASRYYRQHLRINILSRNYVGFAGVNYAVVPVGKPLVTDLEVNYFIYYYQPLLWKVHISVDVRNRTFVDLTPHFVRAVSSAQIDSLKKSLENLSPYGFELTGEYNEVDRISGLYALALEALENEDEETFNIHWQRAIYSSRDLFKEITEIYTRAVGWVPSLIIIFLFFSLTLSMLITDRKGYSILLFVILFLAVFCLFFFTQPHLRLLISNPLILMQSFTFTLLAQLLTQLLPCLIFIILMFFAQIKNFVWETFGVGIRNLRRRRLKTALALSTVLIVSASSMSFLTITTEKPIVQVPYVGITPTVDNGLVIYKTFTQVFPDQFGGHVVRVSQVPIQPHEIEWFSRHEWVKAMNSYGIMKVRFERANGFTLGNFSIFSLVVINASFMAQYQNISDVLEIDWFEDADRNMVIVGSKIAEAYNLEKGSEVLINDRKYTIRSIFNEETAVKKLKDIDGDFFLFKVYNPVAGKIDGESFIFSTLNDFKDSDLSIYRVSIILKDEYGQNATQIAKSIQSFGYDFGKTEDYLYVVTYSVHAISSSSVSIISSTYPSITISGQWFTQIVPLFIATLVLVANTMGTVAERKSEVRTIYTVGASPIRIGLIFLTEGLVLGVVGGVLGYVFGYLLVHYANIALPTLVQENIVGGEPFIIAISTATSASLLGCLLPSIKAIRIAVPSGRLKYRTKDIMKIQEGKVDLKIPIKVDMPDRNLFRRFLEDFADQCSRLNYRFMSVNPPSMEETKEGTLYEITVNYISPLSDEAAKFLVSILANPGEDLKVTVQPIKDFKTKRIDRWRREHKNSITDLCPILREQILKFTELKRKERVSEMFR